MAELDNSARKLLRATYAPITPPTGKPQRSKRAWAKHSFVANLKITPDELNRLKRLLKLRQPVVLALDAVARRSVAAFALDNVHRFAEIDWDSLASVAETLAKLREDELEQFRNAYTAILAAYEKRSGNGKSRASTTRAAAATKRSSHARARVTATVRDIVDEMNSPFPAVVPDLKTALEWAVKNSIKASEAKQILELLPKTFAAPAAITKENFESWALAKTHETQNYAAGIKQYPATEPIGLIHLERLNFVPAGIERGELVHSVPLSPGEEVNISHKEWSNTSEEFSKIVTDFMEAYSEEGVAEKSELAQTTSSQEQHSSGFNTGVTAAGGYGPVSITSSLSYNVADSASHSEQVARNHSSELTRKASARSKKEHKISFKVASAAGTEDQQVRKIKNPFPDKATRVDYYQLVRKWRVDLFRYGLRLTYDLAVPEPGSGILSKIQEVQDITAALQVGFGDPTAPKTSPAWFDLTPGVITRDNYIAMAALYGAAAPKPPAEFKWYDTSAQHQWKTFEEAERSQFFTLEVDVDEDYEIDEVSDPPKHNQTVYEGKKHHIGFQSMDDFYGKSGKRIMVYQAYGLGSLYVELLVRARLRESVFNDWKLKAWSAMRDAAQARYEENRQNLKQRLSSLLEELGAQDPLSLRKIEREEVMKGVIRWLFGPSFDFVPAGVSESYFGSDIAAFDKDWLSQLVAQQVFSTVAAHGEIIKFLHHAIEWENMLYFLYPYFWSHPSRWELKKYLNHPDLMHRVFLKSGSARVVLTIRPGFEKHFVSFLETGKFDPLAANDPYWKITEEMEAYAKTNYPGIRPANPIEGARPLLYPKQKKAWDEMQIIVKLIDGEKGYFEKFGTYPATLNDLQSVLPYDEDPNDEIPPITTVPLKDPWQHDYIYTSPGLYNNYDLVSYGADGIAEKDQTDPEKIADVLNADITSWAEASFIGRWYEYTPTSALDIAFGETLPTA